jgi:hypothetical protein
VAKYVLEIRGLMAMGEVLKQELCPALRMDQLGTHSSVCLSLHLQPRRAEPHSFREKVFRKKAPVCAVCKVIIDGTGVSCRGEVLWP